MRKMLKSKIHRATVTGADLHYEGSITIDPLLMKEADILDNEFVDIWNINFGTRFSTYAISGQPGSGVICINGAAARKVSKGDLVIIASWKNMNDAEARVHKPKLVFVDEKNRRVQLEKDQETPGQGTLKKAI